MKSTDHWYNVYSEKDAQDVSWFEPNAARSLAMIDALNLSPESAVVDMGGGASRLIDGLLDRGFHQPTVVDLAQTGLDQSKARLGTRHTLVDWICADARQWRPSRAYQLWHDRAAFHFMTTAEDQDNYISCLKNALGEGGYAIIASFALDGPEKCSGLPVCRYDPKTLTATLGAQFKLLDHQFEQHRTPWDAVQSFQYSLFKYSA